MTIAVLGAAGWLGRAVLQNLAGRHVVRAIDRGPEAWQTWEDIDGSWDGGEVVDADITDFEAVDAALDGIDAVIHSTVYFPDNDAPVEHAKTAFDVNVRGLWNVLESSRRRQLRRVVHVGSCHSSHPDVAFFDSNVRRPDAQLYAITKRLQEEMCRQFHEGYGSSIVALRPDYIVDSRIGLGRFRETLDKAYFKSGWVCRHDLAEACRLAAEADSIEFDIFHIVGEPEADVTCNAARARDELGLVYRGDLDQWR